MGLLRDPVALVDPSGKVLVSNRVDDPALLSPAADAGDGVPTSIVHPDGRAYEIDEWPVVRSLTTGEVVDDEEFIVLDGSGSRRVFRARSRPIYDSNQHIVAAVVAVREVTEPVPAKESPGEAAGRTEGILENIHDAVIATDGRCVITDWNHAAERMFGWAANQAVGEPVGDRVRTSLGNAEVEAEMTQLAQAGRSRREAWFYGRHGEPVYAEALTVARGAEAGASAGYVCIMRDLTEREQGRRDMEVRAHQQAIIAELGLRARTTDDLTALLDDGVTLAARALRVELATLAELSARGEALIWRSAYGWTKEAIASAPSTSPLAGSLERYTVAAGTAVTSEDVGADERFQVSPRLAERVPKSVLAVLVPGRRDAFGVLVVAAAQRRSFTSDESNFMQAVANVLGLGVERSRAEARLDEVRERERSRIARDLHDEALGELSDVLARASLAQEASSDERDREQWDAVTAALQRVFARLRSSIYDLRLGDGGDRRFADLLGDLVVFQGWMARPADVQLLGQEVLPRGSLGMRGIEVLRIVREAITNARRHSGASSIRVDATQSTAAALRIMVSDDGTWAARSSTEARPLGAGTLGMLERAEVLGAELQIERPPSGGTIVSLELPLERGEEARGGEGALGA